MARSRLRRRRRAQGPGPGRQQVGGRAGAEDVPVRADEHRLGAVLREPAVQHVAERREAPIAERRRRHPGRRPGVGARDQPRAGPQHVVEAKEILSRGPRRLIIKRGEHGALLFDEDGVFAAPGFPLEDVIDPTGAGDAFAGGLIGYLACQPEITALALRRAMLHATATASFCVEAVGTKRIATVTRGDVTARLSEIRALYEFGASTM